MPESRNGRAHTAQPVQVTDPANGSRRRRLATLLADMVPGARTIRVSQREPERTWPSPHTRAYDEQGRPVALNRAQGLTAARWVMRTHPDVNWNEAYDLDLTNGVLRPAAEAYAVADGRR
ncbi:hypothetical protein QRN89_09920 [Streptomyces chengbuensis]|uniref:hypothetical protein n=1 Tax=Streptomyces chengbuensis TaxID=3053466 RepID=UPI0025B36732|nr:hypothetical protein [Streptomyces sp. HUAS CB01]WJY50108.1 hypothetical protein QRN89_09920 [Streptomyces sp. HUAS CB01]